MILPLPALAAPTLLHISFADSFSHNDITDTFTDFFDCHSHRPYYFARPRSRRRASCFHFFAWLSLLATLMMITC
jgi:hypothetical protein